MITHFFLQPYPGGKRTMLMGLDVIDGKAKAVLVSMHRDHRLAVSKRNKLNERLNTNGSNHNGR